MAKANFVKKARKDYPEHGVKKGESYWWWKFNFSRIKYISKEKPNRSQLTQSSFFSTLWAIEDGIEKRFAGHICSDDIQNELENLISEIEELKDEVQGNLDNMPYQLQESNTGQLLQERIDELENWVSDLNGIDTSIEEGLSEEELENKIEEIIEEITSTSSGL
jgi:hypothetical protein